MVSRAISLGLRGLNGFVVTVECYISGGLPGADLVGLPDAAVRESLARVRAAAKACSCRFPQTRLTLNLAPANTKKEGTLYDLPILLCILCAAGELPALPQEAAFLGELSLGGELRPIAGVLPMALAAAESGIKRIYLPAQNAAEAAYASGVEIIPVENAMQLLAHLRGESDMNPQPRTVPQPVSAGLPDFADVRGQRTAKRALEIAAAGGHNILLVGPPGAGKSMLAKRLPSILPDMTEKEILETTAVWSVLGMTGSDKPIVTSRPFRAPHHTVSTVGMAGGGPSLRPGEVSLAHNGVLFLDELPEYHRDVLEVLRQPIEDGEVTITRAAGTETYPSRFMLVCAMNPCRCGWYGHPSGRCSCSPFSVSSYMSRISGPLLDRIDLRISVPSVEYPELRSRSPEEHSVFIKARVDRAREIQRERFGPGGPKCNAEMDTNAIREFCELDRAGQVLMRTAFDSMGLTARSHDRILRVARTIADLAGSAHISREHLGEALRYRGSSVNLA